MFKLLIGKPMYYMEALLGQFASKSSVRMWSSCPIFMGAYSKLKIFHELFIVGSNNWYTFMVMWYKFRSGHRASNSDVCRFNVLFGFNSGNYLLLHCIISIALAMGVL